MAYLQAIYKPKCIAYGCPRPATVVLCSHRNVEYGQYCGTHGREALRVRTREENTPLHKVKCDCPSR